MLATVFSIHTELRALATVFHTEEVPFALCGALALVEWEGVPLWTVNRESLVRLKMLRGNTQDIADTEKPR